MFTNSYRKIHPAVTKKKKKNKPSNTEDILTANEFALDVSLMEVKKHYMLNDMTAEHKTLIFPSLIKGKEFKSWHAITG